MVDIVIVSYNSAKPLKALLPTLEKHTKNYTLTIVDNNSRKATTDYLKTLDANVIYNDKNLGYACAANSGAAATSSPYILFINPDCKVTDGWLEPMLALVKAKDVAAVGPVLFDAENNRYIEDPSSVPFSLRVDGHLNWVSGAVILLKRKVWNKLGSFDDRFFFMWEETEWFQRAVKAGMRVVRSYDSIVIHDGGKSTKLASPLWRKYFHAGRRLFYKLHKEDIKRVLIAVPILGDVNPLFFTSYCNALAGLVKRQFTEGNFEFFFGTLVGHFIYEARNRAVEMALGSGCDYIWFIDSDMVIQADTFDKLIAHNKDIVSTLCFRRGAPYDPMLFKLIKKSAKGYTYDTMKDWPGGELVEVDAIGGGSFLAKTSIFEDMPTPYFFVAPNTGEDIFFSQRLMQAGIKMFVDTNAEIGHIGELVIGEATFRDWQRLNQENLVSLGLG